MMRYNDDIFRIQYPVVGDFVRHLAYFRAAKPIHDRLGLKAPFWTETVNAYLLIATVQWCKVFGAHGSNPTHWRNTPSKDNEAAINSFREKIRTALGCSPKGWADYHRRMCAFRDKYVVHRDDFNDPVPDFDIALNVAYAYDEWIRELIRPDIYDGPLLKVEFKTWSTTASKLLEPAIRTAIDVTDAGGKSTIVG